MPKLLILILSITFFLTLGAKVHAIVDPQSTPNNKFGIHILFTSELSEAAKLVNSNGGDWGYVTIPIQATDRNRDKWQNFMDDASKYHVIPIIRIASENYFFDTKVWRKPEDFDILDFANFLNSLNWPTKNKYIVVFNEVNRSDEWQGSTKPQEYAQILDYTIEAFKSLESDFFIISAGLDNASANVFESSINQYDFMREMNKEVTGIFGKIDGIASHSYPNPAFSQPPWVESTKNISSFKFEKNLAEELGGKKLPVFITETGWSRNSLSDTKIASYMQYAFETVWSDNSIVAVTPFILQSGSPYAQFSFIDENGSHNEIYIAIEKLPKLKGEPVLEAKKADLVSGKENLASITFPKANQYSNNEANIDKTQVAVAFIKWFFKSLNVL